MTAPWFSLVLEEGTSTEFGNAFGNTRSKSALRALACRNRRLASAECSYCGKQPAHSGWTVCEPCNELAKQRMSAHRHRRRNRRKHLRAITSSASCEWATPQDFFDRVNAEYEFDLDACATAENAKCKRYFTKEQDGLRQRWTGRVWCNPPYGRRIRLWLEKAFESVQSGGAQIVVMLIPVRTDTRWWRECVSGRGEIHFVSGRLKFSGCKNPATFASALVAFRAQPDG